MFNASSNLPIYMITCEPFRKAMVQMAQSFTKWPRLTSGLVIFTLKYGKIYKNWKWKFTRKFIFFKPILSITLFSYFIYLKTSLEMLNIKLNIIRQKSLKTYTLIKTIILRAFSNFEN